MALNKRSKAGAAYRANASRLMGEEDLEDEGEVFIASLGWSKPGGSPRAH